MEIYTLKKKNKKKIQMLLVKKGVKQNIQKLLNS